eukprot:jgi/Tetstr1/446809/TSEL_034289.t1
MMALRVHTRTEARTMTPRAADDALLLITATTPAAASHPNTQANCLGLTCEAVYQSLRKLRRSALQGRPIGPAQGSGRQSVQLCIWGASLKMRG